MSGTINIGNVTISTEVAERKLRQLEAELGRTIDRSEGLENALKSASEAVNAQRDALNGLGTATRRAAEEQERLAREAAKAAAEESKAAAEAAKLAEKERLAAEEAARLAAAQNHWAARTNQSLATAARNYNEIAEAIQRAVGIGQGIADLIVQNDRHERALRALGNAYSLVRSATNDVVSAEQALVVQQRISQAGLRISGEELATFLRGARENAVRGNRDVQQTIDQLTDALVQGEAGGLRRFGVALQNGATRAQAFEATLAHFNREQRNTAPLARTAAENVESFGRAAREAAASLGTGLVSGIAAVGRALTENVPILNYFVQTLSQFPAAVRSLGEFSQWMQSNDARPATQDNSGAASSALVELGRATGVNVSGLNINNLSVSFRNRYAQDVQSLTNQVIGIRDPAERRRVFEQGLARIRGTYNSIAAQQTQARRAEQAAAGRPTTAPARDSLATASSGGGGSNNSAQDLATARDEYQRALINALQLDKSMFDRETGQTETAMENLNRLGSLRRPGEDEAAFIRRRAGILQGFADRRQDMVRTGQERTRELQSERETEDRTALENQQRNRGDVRRREGDEADAKDRSNALFDEQNTLLNRTREAWDLTTDHITQSSQRLAQGVRGAFNIMSSAATSHFQALITGRENIGEALQGMLHDTLTALATESFSKSLFETAQGFAALATYRYPEAASHFTAAGIYGAVAAGAGVGAYFSRPQGASQSAGAAAGGGRPSPAARGDTPVGSGGGNVTYVINVESALATQHSVQDELVRAESGAIRRGVANEQQRRARQAATT